MQTTAFDTQLSAIRDLTWFPWLGRNYDQPSRERRLLIVAESHYTKEQDPDKAKIEIDKWQKYPNYTREVVAECCVEQDWSNKTLDAVHNLLFDGECPNREAFWASVGFYNFVQRMMWYQKDDPERPRWEDYVRGWGVFLDVIAVLQPSHCLFIGVESSNHFGGVMEQRSAAFTPITRIETVGRTWGRHATVEINGRSVPLHFVQHSGKYFSPSGWNSYLHRNASELMALVATLAPTAPDACMSLTN